MALGSNELLFKIKGDSSDGVKAVQAFQKELKAIEKASNDTLTPLENVAARSGLTATQFNNLKTGALAAVAGIGAIVGVAATAAAGLFSLAKSASEYGSAIFDASEKTGLTTETLSAMKFAADQSGTSLDSVTDASARFAKTISDAANGSDKAQAKLKGLGVTSTDLDTALSQALATIVKLPPGTQQMTAAIDAFGKSGADLLPFIKSFDGDLVQLTARARELGVTIDREAAQSADEFGDTLDTLSAQAAGVGRTFIGPLVNDITQAMKEVSGSLSRNKDEVRAWGEEVRQTASGLKNIAKDLYDFAQTPAGRFVALLFFGGLMSFGSAIQSQASAPAPGPVPFAPPVATTLPALGLPDPRLSVSTKEQEQAAKAADKAQKEREALAKRDADAVLKIGANVLDTLNNQFQKAYDKLLDGLAAGESVESFKTNVQDLISWYNDAFLDNSGKLDKLELQAAKKEGATRNEIQLLQSKQIDRQVEMADRIAAIRKASEEAAVKNAEGTSKRVEAEAKKTEDVAKHSSESQLAIFRAQSETQIAEKQLEVKQRIISEALYAREVGRIRLEILQKERALTTDLTRQKVLDEEIKQQKIENSIAVSEAIDKETEAQDRLNKTKEREAELAADKAKRDKEAADEKAEQERLQRTVGSGFEVDGFQQLNDFFVNEDNTAAIAGLQAIQQAFQGVAQAVGETVNAFVLYGNAGKSVRQVTAQILAAIAQQAAVQAIYELAQGFAKLAMAFFGVPNAGPSATAHFTAAAIYGTIAGVAAVAGRAVAGDSFKDKSASSAVANQTSGTGAGGASTSRGSDGQGKPWSSHGDDPAIDDRGMNEEGRRGWPTFKSEIRLRIESDDSHIAKVIQDDYHGNGPIRQATKVVVYESA